VLDIAVNATHSAAFKMPSEGIKRIGAYVPDIVLGNVTMEGYVGTEDPNSLYQGSAVLAANQTTNWVSIASGTAIVASGNDPSYVDITSLVYGFCGWLRFVTVGVQTANQTFVVHFSSD